MKERHHILFKNGIILTKPTFKEACCIPYFDIIIKEIDENDPDSKFYLHKFHILNEKGEAINYKIGNFELINIKNTHDNHGLYQDLTFYDLNNSIPFTIRSYGLFISNFYKSVVEFLVRLNELGSYEAYNNHLRIKELERELESDKEEIKTKDQKIKELEEEVKKLKESGI